ncbi:MAG TPA: ABC transporter permease [Pyrinomonadaceae bacterium]|nr:ABC transporter permease [Pyrinomonadaceae bacterium]
METLINDIRYGFRGLRKQPGFTLIAVITLALGIGANTAIFSIISAVLLRQLPYVQSENLVVPWGNKDDMLQASALSYPDIADWRTQTQTLEYVAAYQRTRTLLRQPNADPEPITGATVDADFFPMLRVQAALGSVFTRDNDQVGAAPVIVISHDLWQSRFNSDPQIIGQQIRVGSTAATVIGVMPADFRFPPQATQTDYFRPLVPSLGEAASERSAYQLPVVARLKPGATAAQAENEMKVIGQRLEQQYPDAGFRLGGGLITLQESIVGNTRTSLLVLFGAVGLVLLIACANVANLLLARAATRHREMAIRTALGAGKWRVVRQLLTESLLLAGLGGIVGLLLGIWGVKSFAVGSPVNIPGLQDAGLDPRVFAFTVGITLLTGILFGLAPALSVSRVKLRDALNESGRGGSESPVRRRLRDLLVVGEIALSLVLLIGAGLLVTSFLRLRDVNPGFDAQNVLTTYLGLARAKYPDGEKQSRAFSEIVGRVGSTPGVEAAAVIFPLPFSGADAANTFVIEGQPAARPEDKPEANYRTISADYFKVMRVPLLRGRTFSERDDAKAPPVIIVNESLTRRFFGNADPLGQHITIERADVTEQVKAEIVGVVGDVRHEGFDAKAVPEFYVPYQQAPEDAMDLVVRTSNANMAAGIRDRIKGFDPEQYVRAVQPLTELLSASLARRRFDTLLTGLTAGLALLLAMVGIFGVTAYAVTQRTREIGVRMALGAQPRDVLRLVLGQGLRLILIGIGAGLVAAFALTRVLGTMLYGVTATDPLTFIAVSLGLIFVALLACYIPARRATKVNPLIALRYQ